MNNRLSIVIAFLNEAEEVRNTVSDIRHWIGERADIVVVNDCSDDGYPYEEELKEYGVRYYVNTVGLGAAGAKATSIAHVDTEYFLLLDAHMRFYDSDWLEELVKTLDENDRQILCCQTKVLHKIGGKVLQASALSEIRKKIGAYIALDENDTILQPKWNYAEMDAASAVESVPCVLGAAYCMSKRYWNYLKGYEGLLGFGLEEPYISMKAYMEGGRCLLMKDIIVGHIYRTKFPYRISTELYAYNKIAIASMLLPDRLVGYIKDKYRYAYNIYEAHKEKLDELKSYYQSIFNNDFEYVLRMNNKVELANDANV